MPASPRPSVRSGSPEKTSLSFPPTPSTIHVLPRIHGERACKRSRGCMKRHSEPEDTAPSLREKIIGLGERSIRKSYYPQLRQQLEEAEASRRHLEERSAALLNMLE